MLTRREMEVMNLLCKGYNNGEIAEILVISISTVKAHIESILHKSKAKNRTHAAFIGGQFNILDKYNKDKLDNDFAYIKEIFKAS